MLDIQVIRDNPEMVAEKSKQKGYDVDVTELLRRGEKRRNFLGEVEALKQQRNEIAAAGKGNKPTPEQIDQGRAIKEKIATIEETLKTTEESFYELLKTVPNMPLDEVPVGQTEDQNVEIRTWGE